MNIYRNSGVSVEPDPRVIGTGAFVTRHKLITELGVDEFDVGLIRCSGNGRCGARRRRRRGLQCVRTRLAPFASFFLLKNTPQ